MSIRFEAAFFWAWQVDEKVMHALQRITDMHFGILARQLLDAFLT